MYFSSQGNLSSNGLGILHANNGLLEELKRAPVNKFPSIHALEAWLQKHGIRYDAWGKDSNKSLRNLWQELEAGEVQLKESPPLRVVEVVQIIIGHNNQILVEAEQEFVNGQRRFRNQPPSEKVKPGESIQDAAHRCLEEELGLDPEAIRLDLTSHRQHQTNTTSISYPGLPSQYNFHLLEAAVSGLPEGEFWRENKTEGTVDPVRRHRWAWRPKESVKFIADP
ncbi:NUDIX hydrolase [Candidatus Leptofilum sp.]|uniref:NUDIX hydrolase n=1 Tax=Candidatus Leptofilum sp. TaxID=3241576 RepID=UPI003B59F6E8